MSSPVRLLLSSAPTRRQAAAFAASIGQAADAEGLRSTLVRRTVWSQESVVPFVEAIGRPLGVLGADPVPVERWRSIPSVAHIATWVAVQEALDDPQCDLVVVDAGSFDDCFDMVMLTDALAGLAGALLTAQIAMVRMQPGAEEDPGIFESIAGVRARLFRWAAVLQSDDCAVRLAAPADDEALEDVVAVTSKLHALGVRVDGVCVRSVGKKDKALRKKVTRSLRDITPVPIWARDRPSPKGFSVLGPLSQADPSGLLRVRSLDVLADPDGFTLRIPLPGSFAHSARIGVQAESLVIECAEFIRWLPMPPVLTRCRPIHARRTTFGVDVRWEPAPDRWPSSMSPMGAAASPDGGAT